jgi:hypothetical protein
MGPNPRGKGQAARRVAEEVAPPPFRAVSAKAGETEAGQAGRGRLGQLVTLGGTIAGGSSAASGSIFLPRKAAGDCGQVGGRRRQLTTDQGLAARQPFLRLCQRQG